VFTLGDCLGGKIHIRYKLIVSAVVHHRTLQIHVLDITSNWSYIVSVWNSLTPSLQFISVAWTITKHMSVLLRPAGASTILAAQRYKRSSDSRTEMT